MVGYISWTEVHRQQAREAKHTNENCILNKTVARPALNGSEYWATKIWQEGKLCGEMCMLRRVWRVTKEG